METPVMTLRLDPERKTVLENLASKSGLSRSEYLRILIDKAIDEKLAEEFTLIPDMVDDMHLSPYAYRLYFHIKRHAGESGFMLQTSKDIAAACGMSVGMVNIARNELVKANLIGVEMVKTYAIWVIDIWEENNKKYAGK